MSYYSICSDPCTHLPETPRLISPGDWTRELIDSCPCIRDFPLEGIALYKWFPFIKQFPLEGSLVNAWSSDHQPCDSAKYIRFGSVLSTEQHPDKHLRSFMVSEARQHICTYMCIYIYIYIWAWTWTMIEHTDGGSLIRGRAPRHLLLSFLKLWEQKVKHLSFKT